MDTLITAVTDGQKKQVKRFAEDAVDRAIADDLLNKDSIQKLIENGNEFQTRIIAEIKELSTAGQFADEEVASSYGYSSGYKLKRITEQVEILRQFFPNIGFADEKLAERPFPANAEGWFAIPRWQSVAKTYNEAVEMVFDLLKEQRRGDFYNCHKDKVGVGEQYLRQSENTAKKLQILGDRQKDSDTLIVAAQFGGLHKGKSARRARETFMSNEFGLGVFQIGCMILTHPKRLHGFSDLCINCIGDEYSLNGDGDFSTFLRTPYFTFGYGIRFGEGWGSSANSCYGSASAFLL